MSPDQWELLQDARQSLAAAKLLLEQGFAGYAASRAYYSMFYAAEAMLEGDGLAFSKHSAVIAAFGSRYAKTGRVPKEFHRYLLEAQEMRNKGDYRAGGGNVASDDAETQIDRAGEFLAAAEDAIGPIPADAED